MYKEGRTHCILSVQTSTTARQRLHLLKVGLLVLKFGFAVVKVYGKRDLLRTSQDNQENNRGNGGKWWMVGKKFRKKETIIVKKILNYHVTTKKKQNIEDLKMVVAKRQRPRGNQLAFGSFGIKTLEPKWITVRLKLLVWQ